jgi:sterol desaturase/sphingolipid hydroxylase (fatty acid hydroxylase superfamily)
VTSLPPEWLIRLAAFAAVFGVMWLAEALAPARALTASKRERWSANLALLALNLVLMRLLFPSAAVGIAVVAEQSGSGLFHVVSAPYWIALLASLLVLDLAVYLQHVLFHTLPALWRLHRVHHADLDFDITTGSRFHPLEMLLSMLFKAVVIFALGAPWLAVLIFELTLNAAAVFNHANVRLPAKLERWLRWVIVTPEMHRVHHSAERGEYNSNFGFNLPWWDRALGTYRAQPRLGHQAMTIGLPQPREPAICSRLAALLAMPFRDGSAPGVARTSSRLSA